MKVCFTIEELRRARAECYGVGLVPTMGALHEGHLSLLRAARLQSKAVVVSIFVNPLQFGPNEDFAAYPRTLDADLHMLEREGADVVFVPSPEEMYTAERSVSVDPGPLGERLDGAFRPGHFRGVCTVVAKLFHLVQPDAAFFGQKDAAQVAVLQAMVRELNFPLRLVVCPTVREADGLAMSSRNRYLSVAERERSVVLSRALFAAQRLAEEGETSAGRLREALLQVLQAESGVTLEYAEVVSPETLLPLDEISQAALLAVAVRIGAVRLIDNIVLWREGMELRA